jgi:hypothetical protein
MEARKHMALLTRPTCHRLVILLALILTLAVAMPDLAPGKHRRPKVRQGTAAFVAGFGSPTGSSDPPAPIISPTRFECNWVEFEPFHDYLCAPSPTDTTDPPPPQTWPASFQLKHALTRSGNPPAGQGWVGLASPEFAPQFSCAWDGTPVDDGAPEPLGEQLAPHYLCAYRNPQAHTFTVADIVSVCEDANLLDPVCTPATPELYPPYSVDDGVLDPWYFPDTTPPDTTVTAGPSGLVASREATLEFLSSEDGSTFACRLDGGAWQECEVPQVYEELEDGGHSFEVRATDAASNIDPTPTGLTWEVDATAPDTSILRGPRKTTRDRTPTLTFVASQLSATFECRMDTGSFTRCDSPHRVRRPLGQRKHTFRVRASDLLGNLDDTPARRSFTVDTTGPRVRISGRAARLTRRGLARILVRCPTSELSGLCAGKLTLRSAERLDAGGIVTLGKKGFRVRRGRRGIVKVKLSRQARRLVAQVERLDVRATARARDRVGNVATTRRSFVLEAPGR